MYVIEEYYVTIDSGRVHDAVLLLAEDVEFGMILPTGVTTGNGRAAMLEYLTGRPDVNRRHHLLRRGVDGDVQFAYGAVTENGSRTTGYFLSAMHLDAGGRVDRYQVSFTADLALVPTDLPAGGVRA